MTLLSNQRIAVVAVTLSFVLITVVGCAAHRPTLAESNDLVNVTVMPAGPDNWLYTIQTRRAENLTSVEFISPDLEDCKVLALPEEVEISQEKTLEGIRVSLVGTIYGDRYDQFRSIRLVLASDMPMETGKIKVRVTDFRGNKTLIEPIAGPVARRIGTPRYAWQRAWRSYEIMPQHFGRFPDNLVRFSFIGN